MAKASARPSETAAPPGPSRGRRAETPFPAEGARPPGRWAWVQSAATFGVALVALAIFVVFISGVQIPGLTASGKDETATPPRRRWT